MLYCRSGKKHMPLEGSANQKGLAVEQTSFIRKTKKHNYCLVTGNYISSFCELFFYFFYSLHRSIQPAASRVSRKVQTKQSVNEPFQYKLNPIKNKHMIYPDLKGGPAATPANPQSNHHLLYGQVKHAAGDGP